MKSLMIDCTDLLAAGLYPRHETKCCRRCHHCNNHARIVITPPTKEGEHQMFDEFEGTEPVGRVLLAFCCNVGYVALSRPEIAKLAKIARARARNRMTALGTLVGGDREPARHFVVDGAALQFTQ